MSDAVGRSPSTRRFGRRDPGPLAAESDAAWALPPALSVPVASTTKPRTTSTGVAATAIPGSD